MKYLLFIILFVISLKTVSQNCTALNSFTSFRGIKFGENIPNKLRPYCDIQISVGDTIFTIYKRTLTPEQLNELLLYFYFGDEFSALTITTMPKGQVCAIRLFRYYSYEDTLAMIQKKFPPFYEKITDHLRYLFGEDYKTKDDSDLFGHFYIRLWSCPNISVAFIFNYKNVDESYNLDIVDEKLFRLKKLEDYKKSN